MSAIICVPAAGPSQAHSVPQTVAIGQDAVFLVPLRNPFFGTVKAILSFNIPLGTDLVFKGLGKVRTATKTVDTQCVFTSTDYTLEGSFRGTVFVDVRVDGTSQAVIQVDVV
jgi:hypothetical protein